MSEKAAIKDLPDYFLSRGRHTATSAELADLVGQSKGAVRVGMNRLRKQRQAFSPARGLYVFVPPKHRRWGVPPADWFIDDLMRHLHRDYYVSLLSAAAMHGAAHQRAQVFQAITDKQTPDRNIGRVRLRFFVDQHVAEAGRQTVETPTGTMQIATKETTVSDLVARPRAAAGFSNIATIIREIGALDESELVRLSAMRSRSHARRLGWLVERFSNAPPSLELLKDQAEPEDGVPTQLSPGGPRRGRNDKRWNLLINTPVEPDL